ncbi:MAG TPA: hypothetical protein VIV35_06920 [Chitinophagaceae bacterium]
MNKKEKVFIVNNQEDEDGFNMNPDKAVMHKHVKSVFEAYPRNKPVNKKWGLVKTMSGHLLVSTCLSEKK